MTANAGFESAWAAQTARVRASRFWKQTVSRPPSGPILRSAPKPGEIALDASWSLVRPPASPGGSAETGLDDLARMLVADFAIPLTRRADGPNRLVFRLRGAEKPHDRAFTLEAAPGRITVTAASEGALLRAAIWMGNYWRLIRRPALPPGRRTIRPLVPHHIGADLWGGFSTTQAWVPGRETDTNFIELARVGMTGMLVMAKLDDYLEEAPAPFDQLVRPGARERLDRLAQLVEHAARADIAVILMGYLPKLPPDHPVFTARPQSRGSLQHGGSFRALCSSDPKTLRFMAEGWASVFKAVPKLGGLMAISGGEAFYHCHMRSQGILDCPRCRRKDPGDVVAHLCNTTARAVHAVAPDALFLTWPYSAAGWSGDRDQVRFIAGLDPKHVILQTEIDKDEVEWRPAGYGKLIWDYSLSGSTLAARCLAQRRQAKAKGLGFGIKIECNNAIECLNVPWLPVLENQRRLWDRIRALRPRSVHSRWMFDGSCKAPPEELGFWTLWGAGTPFSDSGTTLDAMAARDFGPAAAPGVRRAWKHFTDAFRHHPTLDYYKGSYFIGPAQPLVLEPGDKTLDPAFSGMFYWLWECEPDGGTAALSNRKPLYFDRPAFRAICRRGPRDGQDVGLEELKALADGWEKGCEVLAEAGRRVPAALRPRFRQEWILARHLALTWRSAYHVEWFLRLRDRVREFSGTPTLRWGHRRENRRDMDRMRRIAEVEMKIAAEDLRLVKGVDFLDLSLRLDMGVQSQTDLLKAKLRQLKGLLQSGLPAWAGERLSFSKDPVRRPHKPDSPKQRPQGKTGNEFLSPDQAVLNDHLKR